MIYLLDTDTMIFMIRGLKAKRPTKRAQTLRKRARALVDRCQRVQAQGHSIAISAITTSELEYGARRSTNYESEIAAVRKILLPFDTYAYEPTLCAEYYGRIRYELETSGDAIGSFDLLITAHALSLGAILVSNNERHFRRIQTLIVENWSKSN